MKNKKKKLLLSSLLAASLLLPTAASAYSGSFSFDIANRIEGTTVHSLANKSTSITSRGNTYYASGTINPNKQDYSVVIYKSWLTTYGASFTADGYSATKSLGTISSGDYTVNVTKTSQGGYGDRVAGSGTVNQ